MQLVVQQMRDLLETPLRRCLDGEGNDVLQRKRSELWLVWRVRDVNLNVMMSRVQVVVVIVGIIIV